MGRIDLVGNSDLLPNAVLGLRTLTTRRHRDNRDVHYRISNTQLCD